MHSQQNLQNNQFKSHVKTEHLEEVLADGVKPFFSYDDHWVAETTKFENLVVSNSLLVPKAETHIEIHSNGTVFPCKICGKTFNHQRNLKRHHLIHTGEKQYQCSYCNHKFRHQSTFKRHERIHTGENPYSCRYCQMNFKQKTHLIKHENIHFTKEQNLNRNICSQNSKNLSILDIIRQQISDNPRKPEMSYNFQTHESVCKNEMNAEECLDLRKRVISEAENIEFVKKELSSNNVPDPFLPNATTHFISPEMSHVTLQPLMPTQGMPMQGMPTQGMPMQGMPMQGVPMQGMPMTTSMQHMQSQSINVIPILAKLSPVDSYSNQRYLPLTSTFAKPMNSELMTSRPMSSMLPSMTIPSEHMSFDATHRFSKLTPMDSHGNQKAGFTPMPTTLIPTTMISFPPTPKHSKTMNSSSMMPKPLSPPSLMATPFASMLPSTPLPLKSLNID